MNTQYPPTLSVLGWQHDVGAVGGVAGGVGGGGVDGVGGVLCALFSVLSVETFWVAPLTNDSNLERCQRYANLLPEM